jgi:hypothetical protein
MEKDRLCEMAVAYRPKEETSQGRPLKRWADFEAGTGVSAYTLK